MHLVDAAFRRVEAIAIGAGRVLGVGSTAEVRRLGDSHTESVNLRGRTLLPGVNDSHLHAWRWGFSQPPFNIDVSYPVVKSIADIVEAVRKGASRRRHRQRRPRRTDGRLL